MLLSAFSDRSPRLAAQFTFWVISGRSSCQSVLSSATNKSCPCRVIKFDFIFNLSKAPSNYPFSHCILYSKITKVYKIYSIPNHTFVMYLSYFHHIKFDNHIFDAYYAPIRCTFVYFLYVLRMMCNTDIIFHFISCHSE